MFPIDLRSDTVTRPTDAMREAMARAEVGDDVYGEDPTVNRLQEKAAELLGKQAALLVPSGTMGNQASIHPFVRPGDVILGGENAHILLYESGAPAALSGVQVETLGNGGLFDADDVRAAIHPSDAHYSPTRMVCLENTHNRAGGRVFPLEQIKGIAEAAREHELHLHLDGARLFNAVVATGIPASTWAEPFDTVTFCLSKGLGAPAGSIVCGSTDVIWEVHRARKRFGGGMRQAGILAAAGIYALDHHVERLAEDHAHTRRLADGLVEIGYTVDPMPETNMVMFNVQDTKGFIRATRERDLWIDPMGKGQFRAVTHLDVSADDIEAALDRLADVMKKEIR
ncbi:MAG: low-specificity L-threonine aldolase [Acidobacteria bacterium]|nr:MAG: low-specificity L-threonine aldolase [Acidobacteriota bacterium]